MFNTLRFGSRPRQVTAIRCSDNARKALIASLSERLASIFLRKQRGRAHHDPAQQSHAPNPAITFFSDVERLLAPGR